MAQLFKVNTLVLSRQLVTATGSNLYVNGLLVGSGTYATIDALAQTGSVLYQDIVGLSGALNVSGSSFLSLLQSTGQTLYSYTVGLSGATNTLVAATGQAAWTSANGTANTISGNLTATGIALIARDSAISGVLDTKITVTGSLLYVVLTGMSGQANLNFATLANLTLTGQTLFNRDAAISGGIQSQIAATGQAAWISANGAASTISGNLTTSGTLLSSVKVTGSAIINNVNLTGLGGTLVIYSGGFIFVSGAAGIGNVVQGQIDALSGWVKSRTTAFSILYGF